VTGFRLAPGGAMEYYGLRPDIVTYGKALGQGFPVAAIAGPDHIMEAIEHGKVLHFGSHNAPRLGLYATKTMLEEMTRDDNAGFRKITAIGDEVTNRLNEVARAQNKNRMIVQSAGSMFHPVFTDLDEIDNYRDFCAHADLARYRRFARRLRELGIFMTGNTILHNLSCTEHTPQDIEATVNAVGTALEDI